MDRFDEEIEGLMTAVIGCAIRVHRALGPGHPEGVYGNALAREMFRAGLTYEREHRYQVMFVGEQVGEGKLDFWVGNRLVVELKAVKSLDMVHVAQVVAYLTQKKEPVGLLLNFQVAVMKGKGIKRVILSNEL
jgi:GxxExxY protein